MYEVREVESDEVWAQRASLARATSAADTFHIGTGKHFAVVELKFHYTTLDSSYTLRPAAEMACAVLSRAHDTYSGWLSKVRGLARLGS